jgi:hypothetical protein
VADAVVVADVADLMAMVVAHHALVVAHVAALGMLFHPLLVDARRVGAVLVVGLRAGGSGEEQGRGGGGDQGKFQGVVLFDDAQG